MRTVLVVLLVLVVLAAAAWAWLSNRRRARLRARFGPEYDRVVAERGGTRPGEKELQAREQRRAGYEVRALTPEARQRYRTRWTDIQTAFVDGPDGALRDADALVTDVLAERGYPTRDRQQLVGDLSVDLAPEHADVLDRFRAAHEIFVRNEQRQATTEDLRRGMQQYRALMEELAGEPDSRAGGVTSAPAAGTAGAAAGADERAAGRVPDREVRVPGETDHGPDRAPDRDADVPAGTDRASDRALDRGPDQALDRGPDRAADAPAPPPAASSRPDERPPNGRGASGGSVAST